MVQRPGKNKRCSVNCASSASASHPLHPSWRRSPFWFLSISIDCISPSSQAYTSSFCFGPRPSFYPPFLFSPSDFYLHLARSGCLPFLAKIVPRNRNRQLLAREPWLSIFQNVLTREATARDRAQRKPTRESL